MSTKQSLAWGTDSMSPKDNLGSWTCFMSTKENQNFGNPLQNKSTLKNSDLELKIYSIRPYHANYCFLSSEFAFGELRDSSYLSQSSVQSFRGLFAFLKQTMNTPTVQKIDFQRKKPEAADTSADASAEISYN